MNLDITKNSSIKYMFAVLLFLYALTFLEVQNTFSIIFEIDFPFSFFEKEQAKFVHILLFTSFLSLGMYIFAKCYKKFPVKEQKFILIAVIILKLVTTSFYTLQNLSMPALYIGALFIFSVGQGFISALVLCLAVQNIKKQYLSMFIGTSLSLAVAITVVTGLIMDYVKIEISNLENYLCQFLLIIGLWYLRTGLLLKNHSSNRYEKTSSSMRIHLFMCILIDVLLSLIHGFSDGMQVIVLEKHAVDVEYVYADFRFLYIISLLLAGYLFEKLKSHRIMLALLAAILIWMCIYLYEYKELYLYTFALAEFASGFFVVFVICIFINVANSTRSPLLWCNIGRIIEYPVNTVGAILGFQFFSYASNILLLLATLGLFFAVIVVLFRYSSSYQSSSRLSNIQNLYRKEKEQRLKFQKKVEILNTELEKYRKVQKKLADDEKNRAQTSPVSIEPENQFEKFIEEFALTAKEQEVLAEIKAMTPIKDIAGKFSISERTVKYRIASILKKANVKNQRELVLRYFSGTKEE